MPQLRINFAAPGAAESDLVRLERERIRVAAAVAAAAAAARQNQNQQNSNQSNRNQQGSSNTLTIGTVQGFGPSLNYGGAQITAEDIAVAQAILRLHRIDETQHTPQAVAQARRVLSIAKAGTVTVGQITNTATGLQFGITSNNTPLGVGLASNFVAVQSGGPAGGAAFGGFSRVQIQEGAQIFQNGQLVETVGSPSQAGTLSEALDRQARIDPLGLAPVRQSVQTCGGSGGQLIPVSPRSNMFARGRG